jgi:hypothetical protein
VRYDEPWFSPQHQLLQQIADKQRLQELMYRDPLHLHSRGIIDQMLNNDRASYQAHVERAAQAAVTANDLYLPTGLESFRTPHESLADKLFVAQQYDWWQQQKHLDVFNTAAAVSNLFDDRQQLTRDTFDLLREFSQGEIAGLRNLTEYRSFLDSSGLLLPRWPHQRLLSVGEKRRRLQARLTDHKPSPHVRAATKLVHQYERVLRETIHLAMSDEYGDDWPEHRLPICGCKGLLGKWKSKGYGEILDHADYADYIKIVTYSEHFEAIFSIAFDEPGPLCELLTKAGKYRADSHHARSTFSGEDLLQLRLTWKSLEALLMVLDPDYGF